MTEYQMIIKPLVILTAISSLLYIILKILQKKHFGKYRAKNNILLEQVFYIDSQTKIASIISKDFSTKYLLLIQKNDSLILDTKKYVTENDK